MLTLRPAFEEADRRRLLPQLAQEDPPRPRQFNPAIPRDLETIVLKAIARGPEHRYRSAGELAADLERFLENRPIHARPVPGYVRAWRWCRRNRAVAALGATAAILLVTVALGASVGYVQRTRALRTEAQLREEAESARHRAEANLGLAAQAFEEVFDRVAGLPIPEAPGDNDADNDLPGDSSTLPVVGARDAAILERLLAFYDQFAEQNQDSARWQQETARAFRRVGEIHLRLGRHPEAESACRRALALYDVLLKNPDVAADCLAGTAATYNLLGLVAMEDGRPAVALERFRRARQTLLSRPEILDASAVCRTELARACNRSALAALVQPPPPPWAKARPGSADTPPGELLRQAIQIAQSLLKETPHQPEYLLTLAESYRHLWGVEARSGHRKQAAQAREEAIRILEATMTEHADNADCRAALVETYLLPFRFADPRSPPTDPDRHMDRALGTAEDLVGRYPQVPKYKSLLAQAHFTAAQIAAWKGQGEQADKHCQQAVATQKELLEQAPSAARYQFDLIRYLDERIRICRDAGRTTALAAALKDQIDVLERRPTGMQDSPWVRGRLIRSHDELAGILKQQGDTAGAERAYAKAKLLRDGPASGKKALMTP
jgi:tetratricopeptide (TPR) repeat protein